MRRFYTVRKHDNTGISGTGFIAEGVELRDGRVLLCWLGNFRSTIIYESMEAAIHVHGHNGNTEFVFVDVDHFNPSTKFKPPTGKPEQEGEEK